MDSGPVNSACSLDQKVKASFTAAWLGRSIRAADTCWSATAHKVETDFTGKMSGHTRQTVCVRGRSSFAISSRQLPGITGSRPCPDAKNARGDLRPHRPTRGLHGAPARQTGRDDSAAKRLAALQPERAEDTIDDLERRAQLGHCLEVALGQVWSFQPPSAELGKRVQTAAEQRSHLLGGHRVAGGQAADPVHSGTDPHPRRLTPLGVVRRQPGMTFLGRVQGSHLPGQIVIPGTRSELVDAHRHTHPKGKKASRVVKRTRATSVGASGVSSIEF